MLPNAYDAPCDLALFRGGDLGVRKAGDSRVWDAVLITAGFWVLAASLWMDVDYMGATLERISTQSMAFHVDFDSFWRSARAMLEGQSIYDTGVDLVNLNPPLWTVLISPLGLLESVTAYRVFVLVSLAVGLVAAWVADRRDGQEISGAALGLVVSLKPSLLPVLLWPLARRRWRALAAALISGAVATLVGVIVLGPGETLDYIGVLREQPVSAYWDNASLPSAAARLFTENPYAQNVTTLPWMVGVGYALGVIAIVLTAMRVRHGPEVGLWVLVAASLLASPIAWHNYLV